jgi:hypothetical protein
MNSSPKMDSTGKVKHYKVRINGTCFLYRKVQSVKEYRHLQKPTNARKSIAAAMTIKEIRLK